MALNATPKSPTANSYTTVSFADNYLLSERFGASDWQLVNPSQKEAALIQATRILERYHWQGWKTASDQALKMPVSNLYDDYGELYDPDTVPADVQRGCAELAFALTQDPDLMTSAGTNRYKSIEIEGDVFTFDNSGSGGGNQLPPAVMGYIEKFLATTQATVVR